jgi:3-dehydroquinate synthase
MENIINFDIQKPQTNYQAIIGNNIFDNFGKILKEKINCKKILVVTDENVNNLYGSKMKEVLDKNDFTYDFCIFKSGEEEKNSDNLNIILDKAFENKLERQDCIVAFGGGVIGDMAGFAASIYLRGINFIQAPTTLLAQIDSSIGGKTAINTKYGKNLVGAFYQPKFVFTDISFLKTLPLRELKTGLGEALKYAFIEKNCDENKTMLFEFLLKNKENIFNLEDETMLSLVKRCVELKRNVVTKDEKENSLRMVLNFGHTIGHAIEKVTQYKVFTHGEAITIGMKAIFEIALRIGKITQEYYEQAINLLNLYEFDLKLPNNINSDEIYNALIYDKKVRNSKVKFVTPTEKARVEIFDNIVENIIKDVLTEL